MRTKLVDWLLRTAAACAVLAPAPDAGAADPVAECIGANERHLSLRKQGKLLDARRELAVCAASTCPQVIREACRARIGELNAAIPSVVFDVKDAIGRDRMDATVSIDGEAAGAVGVAAVPLDPGRHTFHFDAPGEPSRERTLVLREGDKETRVSVVLGRGNVPGVALPPAASESLARSAQSVPASDREADSTRGGPQRTLGWIIAGAGVATAGAGGALALIAKSSWEGASGCSGKTCSSQAGIDATNSARDLGTVATALLVAGGAVAAGGLVVVLAAPHGGASGAARPTWEIGLSPRGVMARGEF